MLTSGMCNSMGEGGPWGQRERQMSQEQGVDTHANTHTGKNW